MVRRIPTGRGSVISACLVGFCSLGEQPHIIVASIASVARKSRDLNKDALADKPSHEFVRRGAGCPSHLANLFHRDDCSTIKAFENAVTVGGRMTKVVRDDRAMLFTKRKNAARRLGRLCADGSYAAKEESEPSFRRHRMKCKRPVRAVCSGGG